MPFSTPAASAFACFTAFSSSGSWAVRTVEPGPAMLPNLLPKRKPPIPWIGGGCLSASQGPVEEPFQLAAADRVLQLPYRFGLDLPHPLAGHLEDAADLLQRVRVA